MWIPKQNVTGDLIELRFHMTALQRMVKMRGGMENINNGTLRMVLTW
jgi:hypothetical protein